MKSQTAKSDREQRIDAAIAHLEEKTPFLHLKRRALEESYFILARRIGGERLVAVLRRRIGEGRLDAVARQRRDT